LVIYLIRKCHEYSFYFLVNGVIGFHITITGETHLPVVLWLN
jgi:hypothetical protein